jgi:hypothetical protein
VRSVSRLRPEANKDNSETAAQRKGNQFYFVALTWSFRRNVQEEQSCSLKKHRFNANEKAQELSFLADVSPWIPSTRLGDVPRLLQTTTLQLQSDCLNSSFSTFLDR